MSRPDASNSELSGNGSVSYIDTHCHLDGENFASDLAAVLDRARGNGVIRWINVGYSPDRWQPSIDLASAHRGLSYMLGLHPGHADEWSRSTESRLRELIERTHPVAIGEIGLDFFRGETNVDQQIDAFRAQLDIAREVDLPVAIHMRESESLMLEELKRRPTLPTMLFHSFDGSSELTDWVIQNGAWIGVGGLSTRSKSAPLREQIRRISLDRIVLETDSPYLVPNGFKHRRNTPESIPFVARMLAELFGASLKDVSEQTTHNAEQLFRRLPSP